MLNPWLKTLRKFSRAMVSVNTSKILLVKMNALTILNILLTKLIGDTTLSPSMVRVTYNRALPPGMAMRARTTPTRD